jgi:zinc transport system substrate-binding protein
MILRLLAASTFLAVLSGCRETPSKEETSAPSSSRPVVAVANHPLECFAKRIAADLAEVVFPAPASVDPAYWQPDAAALGVYRDADLILLNGTSYAAWTASAPLSSARTIDTSAGFRDRLIKSGHTFTHSHGPGGEHEHRATDFNTWLDPSLARLQAQATHKALVRLLPDHAGALDANAAALDRELAELEDGFESLFARGKPPFIASHPVYDYFARRYALDLVSLHWEPDTLPDDSEWGNLSTLFASRPAAVMLWEDDPIPAVRERLEKLGLPYVVLHPAANRPDQGDFLTAMQANLARLGERVR